MENYRIAVPAIKPEDIDPEETVVLIDNLRASSTIVTALSLGIGQILPMVDDEKVFKLKADRVITAGESGGEKLDGYDIGNSPVELETFCKHNPCRTLIIKTSNLVPLLLKFSGAVICSSLNLDAVVKFLKNKRSCIIPAFGRYGSAEDLGVALALGAKITQVSFNDDLISCFTRESAAAKHLAEIGYEQDVKYIARTSIYDIVPVFDGQKIIKV